MAHIVSNMSLATYPFFYSSKIYALSDDRNAEDGSRLSSAFSDRKGRRLFPYLYNPMKPNPGRDCEYPNHIRSSQVYFIKWDDYIVFKHGLRVPTMPCTKGVRE